LLGGMLTLAVMVMFDLQFNFANVVALPLLLGVAVDNGIHLVQRHRAGLLPDGNVLATATARAIVVGALITAGGFGNLMFSPHAGTASLGAILAMGLGLMVIATLLFLPAMLGRRIDS
ncbi:MAG: hopanoid biosynthesis-associated RND transporter HpnN, partial [Wenzhouxiangellaceae bacterium]